MIITWAHSIKQINLGPKQKKNELEPGYLLEVILVFCLSRYKHFVLDYLYHWFPPISLIVTVKRQPDQSCNLLKIVPTFLEANELRSLEIEFSLKYLVTWQPLSSMNTLFVLGNIMMKGSGHRMNKMWLLSNKAIPLNSIFWWHVWFLSIPFIRKAGKQESTNLLKKVLILLRYKVFRRGGGTEEESQKT